MKVKNYPCLLTDEELKAEIERIERRVWKRREQRMGRAFANLLNELKRRQQTPPPAEAAQ